MPGAARLAGEACLRAGAGLVTIATRTANVAAIVGTVRNSSAMVGGRNGDRSLIERATSSRWPGSRTGNWAKSLFERVIASARPLLIDATRCTARGAPMKRADWY